MFKNLYFGELRKMCRPKTMIVFAAIILIGFVILTLAVNLMNGMTGMADEEEFRILMEQEADAMLGTSYAMPNIVNIERDEIDSSIAAAKAMLREAELSGKAYPYNKQISADTVYAAKAKLAGLEYIRDHELYGQTIYVYQGGAMSFAYSMFDATAYSFAGGMLSVFAFIIIVYGVIIGSGAFANELKDGTIKLLMIRPVSRNQVTGAKLLAALTITFFAYMLVFLLCVIYGYIRYDAPVRPMMFIFNATSVYVQKASVTLCISFFLNLITILSFVVLSFAIGLVTKNRAAAIALPLAINLAGGLLAYAAIGRFLFEYVVSFDQYFSFSAPSYGGSNFFLGLGMFVLYIGAIVASTFLIFKKRDVV